MEKQTKVSCTKQAEIIKQIDNGCQLAEDFTTEELRAIVAESAASKSVFDACKKVLRDRKR